MPTFSLPDGGAGSIIFAPSRIGDVRIPADAVMPSIPDFTEADLHRVEALVRRRYGAAVAIELVRRHIPGVAAPLDVRADWHVLCELASSGAEALDATLQSVLAAAMEQGLVLDAAIATSERQRQEFWRLRESIPEAQRKAGPSLKHDISVPVSALPDFVAQASAWVRREVPEGVLVSYGHAGDGNLHFNINLIDDGSDSQAFRAREPVIRRVIHDMVARMHGSFSAEHGIGRLKVGELARYADPVELELMRAVKRALDPNGIMNPGKVLQGP